MGRGALAACGGLRLAVLGALALCLVMPQGAGAVTQIDSGPSPITEFSQNTEVVGCAVDERVLGGGVYASTDPNDSVVVGTGPDDGDDLDAVPDDGWEVFSDVGDTSEAEYLTSYALCQGGNAGSRLEYKSRSDEVQPASTKTKSVRCPDGYKATGGGVAAGGSYNATSVEVTRPIDSGTRWEGRVRNISPNPKGMVVYVVCATGGFAKDLVRRTGTYTTTSPGRTGLFSTGCPAGGVVTGGGSRERHPDALLAATHPSPDGTSWVGAFDIGPSAVGTTIQTYAICKT